MTLTLHFVSSKKAVFVIPTRCPPCDDPSWRQAQLASDHPTTHKTVVNMGSQPCLIPNQRTPNKFVCFKHCGNRGNSNVSQKQRPRAEDVARMTVARPPSPRALLFLWSRMRCCPSRRTLPQDRGVSARNTSRDAVVGIMAPVATLQKKDDNQRPVAVWERLFDVSQRWLCRPLCLWS